MSVAEILSIVKDFIVAGAALTASIVSILGLDAWRRQLSGNTKHQLAKNILVCIYELRDRIEWVRHPYMSYSTEPDLPVEKLQNLTGPEKKWHALVQAYEKRWEPIPLAKAKLDVNLWEAEAVLDRDIVSKTRGINVLLNELLWAIRWDLEEKNPTNRNGPLENSELYKKRTRILFAGHSDDEFKNRVDALIGDLEKGLRRYIVVRRN